MERRRYFRSLMSLGIVAALVGAVALASSGVQQPDKVCAQASQCHYTQMTTGAQELGYASPTGTFMRPQQTATLEFTGPYQGTLILSPESKTAIGTAEDVACGTAGQDVTLEKGSGTLTFYAKNCGTSPAEVQFSVDMVDECRRPALSTKFGVNMNDGQGQPSNQPQDTRQQQCANPHQNGGGNGNGNGGGGNNGNGNGGGNNEHPRLEDAGTTAVEAQEAPSGSESDSLGLRYLVGAAWSTHDIVLWWPTKHSASEYRISARHSGGTIPPGVGALPEHGWTVPHDARYTAQKAWLGGLGTRGLYPGGTYTFQVQAIDGEGNYGEPSPTTTITTFAANHPEPVPEGLGPGIYRDGNGVLRNISVYQSNARPVTKTVIGLLAGVPPYPAPTPGESLAEWVASRNYSPTSVGPVNPFVPNW